MWYVCAATSALWGRTAVSSRWIWTHLLSGQERHIWASSSTCRRAETASVYTLLLLQVSSQHIIWDVREWCDEQRQTVTMRLSLDEMQNTQMVMSEFSKHKTCWCALMNSCMRKTPHLIVLSLHQQRAAEGKQTGRQLAHHHTSLSVRPSGWTDVSLLSHRLPPHRHVTVQWPI